MVKSVLGRRLLRLSFLIGVPLLLLPTLFPRKLSARRLAAAPSATGSPHRESVLARGERLQDLVNEIRAQLEITSPVLVSLVPENKLVVSVERSKSGNGAFSLLVEAGFLDGLTDDEERAVVAHELGHVWIFTHHPYLQTEEQANQIAMRVVERSALDGVYEKVWKRTGAKGSLVYLPVE